MMRRWMTAAAAAGMVLGAGLPAGAQATAGAVAGWNDSTTMALVTRGVARRAQQLADTGLRDYTARANGYLTFLGQLGEGFAEPPRILKADQLALEVYWRAPDESKQRIIGRRDTLLLPTDINYHRDHLGIIQNNFPEIIRLGDGDEVRDVPHPLSAAGVGAYDFRIRDSLRIAAPGRTLDVYEVMVRPRNDREARVIGSVFIERSDAQVVRMAFGFTRAAFLDRQLEDLSIVLENGLVDGRFWLPRRQEIEIRRAGTWLDYPARGIIRGRWEIGSYVLNAGVPPTRFQGAEIVLAPQAELARFEWEGRVLDSLPPDVRAPVDADIARVQEEARSLVRAQALRRATGSVLSARAISDIVRSNRVEGLAVGAGVTRQFGAGFSATARVRYGTGDATAKGALALEWRRASGVGVRAGAHSDFADAGDVAERSGVVNSIASQEFGSDYTDPYLVQGGTLDVHLGRRLGLEWSTGIGWERQHDLAIDDEPASGAFEGVIAFPRLDVRRARLRVGRPTALGPFGTEVQLAGELRVSRVATRDGQPVNVPEDLPVVPPAADAGAGSRSTVTRASAVLRVERPIRRSRLLSNTVVAAAGGTAGIPPQELAYFGGPVSAPGHDYHSLASRAGFSQRLELQLPVPFAAIPLGRFGRSPAEARVAPFVTVVGVDGGSAAVFRRGIRNVPELDGMRPAGLYPSLGVGFLAFFDLVRFDVARGMRDGRWSFHVDVNRDFWRIL